MTMHLRRLIDDEPISGAWFSDDAARVYRWALWRLWHWSKPILLVSMLNPSTADHRKNDLTVGRVIKFAKRDGYGGVIVLNAYAFRSSNPKDLLTVADPAGPLNGMAHAMAIDVARESWGGRDPVVLVAHGAGGGLLADDAVARFRSNGCRLVCLGTTGDGHPKHPLARGKHLVPEDAPMVDWDPGRIVR